MSSGDTAPHQFGRDRQEERWFQTGSRFIHSFALPQGEIEFRATVKSEGPVLRLWDVDFLPIGGVPLRIGVRGVRSVLTRLREAAAEEGFDWIAINGVRAGGADPGRDAEWLIPGVKRRR